MNLAAVLRRLYPGIVIGEQGQSECTIEMLNGSPRIEQWHRQDPQPTMAEIEAAWPAVRLAGVTAAIKAKARAQILSVLPEWKQANSTARAVELVAAGQASGPEWEAMQAAWAWVKAVREYSNTLEQQAAQMADPTTLDIEAGWPVP